MCPLGFLWSLFISSTIPAMAAECRIKYLVNFSKLKSALKPVLMIFLHVLKRHWTQVIIINLASKSTLTHLAAFRCKTRNFNLFSVKNVSFARPLRAKSFYARHYAFAAFVDRGCCFVAIVTGTLLRVF